MYTSSGLGGWLEILTFGLLGNSDIKRKDADSAVNQIYLELLERPSIDDPGSEGFVRCLMTRECNVDFVRTEVLSSPEFRALQEGRVRRELEARTSRVSDVTFSGLVAGLPSSVAGIPLMYIVGGVAALLLLKKKR